MSDSVDPFNCPRCGAHDYGLWAPQIGECPWCLKAIKDAAWELSCYAAAIHWNPRAPNTQEFLDGLEKRINAVQELCLDKGDTAP